MESTNMNALKILDINKEASSINQLDRIKSIIDLGLTEQWPYSDVIFEINREHERFRALISIHNLTVKESIVRRELKLPYNAVVTSKQMAAVFNLFDPDAWPDS